MDYTATLKPDVFRVWVVILLPGIVTVTPWLAWYFWPEVAVRSFWNGPAALPAVALIFVLSTAAGLLLEDLGSVIEAKFLDRLLQRKGHDLNWDVYLECSTNESLVAVRYLREKITRMKFEISFGLALFSTAIAIAVGSFTGNELGRDTEMVLAVACVVVGLWLLYESRQSAALLARTRGIIVRACSKSR